MNHLKHLKTLTLLAACYAFTVNAQTSTTLPAYTIQAPPTNSAGHTAIQDITKNAPRSALPSGHSEKPLTIKPAAGKGIRALQAAHTQWQNARVLNPSV
jgi:hypothetical protein